VRWLAVLARDGRGSDLLLAAGALALVAVLVAPLPPALLDVLLAANLALSATILVVTLFAKDALGFASFPTLLLFTTLFRLALNVSSTRLVLTRGDAGRVIEAFGRVVVQGNWVVGAVVFAILAVVQLLVVAKGSERVAEVAARFTLDALPGKQMSIDADLRAGHLDGVEARRRRRALERESQLYAAMDGALKFVKGDAVAGLAIVLVNVGGGLAAGALRGMPLGAAARKYAVLAIGDGLVSQLPALLVALAAGVAVTRVAAEDEAGTLGRDIARQLFDDPRALAAVAALLAALALAPGLPAAPFAALAAAAAAGARHAARGEARAGAAPEPAGDGATDADDPGAELAVVEVGPGLLALLATAPGGPRGAGAAIAEALWRDRGVRIPALPLRAGRERGFAWRLDVDAVTVARGELDPARALCLAPPDELALAAIEAAPARDPSTGAAASSVALADAGRAARLGPLLPPAERFTADVAAALARHAHAIVGVQEVQTLLDALEAGAPALVREVARALPAATVAEVLRRLLEEQVSIRPLRTILQAMLEAGGAPRGAAGLAEACRRAVRRHIASSRAGDGALAALLLDPLAEARLRGALTGEVAAVPPALLRELLASLEVELGAAAVEAPVLVAGPDVRRALRQLVAPRFPDLAVLSWDELPPDLPVRPLARIAAASA
jgi:type III secretion protein V